jgi:hypothetical protein
MSGRTQNPVAGLTKAEKQKYFLFIDSEDHRKKICSI